MIWAAGVDRAAVRASGTWLDDRFGPGTTQAVLEGLDRRAVADDHPVVFDEGQPLEALNVFLRDSPYAPSTATQYAGDLTMLARFLDAGRGVGLLECTSDDLTDFRRARTAAVSNVRWERQAAVIKTFYRRQMAVGTMATSPVIRWPDADGRDALAVPINRHRLVAYLSAAEYQQFRRHGLAAAGQRPGARDCLYADLLVETGCRRAEINRLSWLDVPDRLPAGNPFLIWVVGKGAKQRQVYMTGATLRRLINYRFGVRAEVVEARQGLLERRVASGELVMCEAASPDGRGRARLAIGSGRPRPTVDIDEITLRRLVLRTPDGTVDPVALFVSEREALMPRKEHWNKSFAQANERCAVGTRRPVADAGSSPSPSTHLRRARPEHLHPPDRLHPTDVDGTDLEDPRLFVQRLLGHTSPTTTARYLEAAVRERGEVLPALAEMSEALLGDSVGDGP